MGAGKAIMVLNVGEQTLGEHGAKPMGQTPGNDIITTIAGHGRRATTTPQRAARPLATPAQPGKMTLGNHQQKRRLTLRQPLGTSGIRIWPA